MNKNATIVLCLCALVIVAMFSRIPMANATTYHNRWTWEGRTEQYSDTTATVKEYAPAPTDPFPFEDVKRASEITILSETTQKFQEEMSKLSITTTITKIEPNAWIETTLDMATIHGVNFDSIRYTWHHWLHMKAIVYFDSDKPIVHSSSSSMLISSSMLVGTTAKVHPIFLDPLTLAALVHVIEYLILVLTAAAVILIGWKIFVQSFLVTTQIVETYDPSTGKWTTETITQPSTQGTLWMIIGIIAAAIVAIMFIQTWGKKKH